MPSVRGVAGLALVLLCSSAAAQEAKHKVVQGVFDQIVRAVGDGRTPPHLRLLAKNKSSRNKVIWFNPDRNTIILEERAYDLCSALGADSLNALAFLLGHELAHFYKDHGWVGDFGSSFADLGMGQRLTELGRSEAKLLEIETEADYFGGFYGHLAGYNSLAKVEEILPRIYAEYRLEEDLRGYPSLEERQKLARKARDKLAGLLPIFEAGGFFLLVKRYEEGARCFDRVASEFPSREILNNAGVARALEALGMFETGKIKLAYPFEFDPETRLHHSPKASEYDWSQDELRRRLLLEAQDLFSKARDRDRAYTPAWVNSACAADLLGEYDEAIYLATKGIKLARQRGEETILAHALIARGIAKAHTESAPGPRASADFEQALAGAPALAQINLAALAPTAAKRVLPHKPVSIEKIAGIKAEEYGHILQTPDQVAAIAKVDRSQPAIDIYSKANGVWQGLVVEAGYSTFSFLRTQPAYGGSSALGIEIGDSFDKVLDSYGPPSYLVGNPAETYQVYAKHRIAFCTDGAGIVREWILFAVK